METSDAIQLIITGIVAIWGIYQTQVTGKLQKEVNLLNVGLDQSIQRLHRAREAVIQQHKANVYLMEYVKAHKESAELTSEYFEKHAELSAFSAELRGLAFAIGDKDLLNLVNQSSYSDTDNPVIREMEIRGRSQRLHTRISELLETASQLNGKDATP